MKIDIRHSSIKQSAQQNNVKDTVCTIVNSNQSSIGQMVSIALHRSDDEDVWLKH